MSSDQLKLVSLCAYLTDVSNSWRDLDYTASKMVKALKGDTINGYFDHKIRGKNVRFTQANVGRFVERIPPALARMIARKTDKEVTLVPIPNSHVVAEDTENFRTLDLAKKIAEHGDGQFEVVPALVFKEPQVKSREGGPRSSQHFEQAYKKIHEVEGPIVLIDDVCTGGGHLIGAQWKLESPLRSIELAATFGRSTRVQFDEPIGIREELLDARRPPKDLAERLRRLLGK